MTRVSLKEAYDNKDVVAQIYAIRDTAESAEDSAEQAVTVANGARQHVDELVPQVEQAVVNANTASASAQTSAQTVAGYENRLGAVETGLSTAQHDITAVEDNVEDLSGDLNAVTLRVQTAEGNIVTIQGRVTALETADGQNVKIDRINDYAVGLTGNQTKAGQLTLTSGLTLKAYQAETIEATNGPKIGTNPSATQVIMRLYQNSADTDYVTRDTVFQSANTKNVSRIWYLQRQNEAGDGVDNISLSLTFNAQGRASLTITDSQGTRVIV